jgi:hypothetical protein
MSARGIAPGMRTFIPGQRPVGAAYPNTTLARGPVGGEMRSLPAVGMTSWFDERKGEQGGKAALFPLPPDHRSRVIPNPISGEGSHFFKQRHRFVGGIVTSGCHRRLLRFNPCRGLGS